MDGFRNKQPQKEFLMPINQELSVFIGRMTRATGLSSVQLLELSLPIILALLNFVIEIIRILPKGHGYDSGDKES